jgi:hypothetical protein
VFDSARSALLITSSARSNRIVRSTAFAEAHQLESSRRASRWKNKRDGFGSATLPDDS